MMKCNKECECKLKHTITEDILSVWSNKIKYAKGEVLCMRGGVECIHNDNEHKAELVFKFSYDRKGICTESMSIRRN